MTSFFGTVVAGSADLFFGLFKTLVTKYASRVTTLKERVLFKSKRESTEIRRNSSRCVNSDRVGCGLKRFYTTRSERVPLGVKASESCFVMYCCCESVEIALDADI